MQEIDENFFGVREEEDIFTLLHRQIHFGGKFSVMIDYYETEGIGTHPEISLKRLYELQNLEQVLQEDLASLFLGEEHQDIIQDSLRIYNQLKDVYQSPSQEHEIAIADLLLAEKENLDDEIERVVQCGDPAVPLLIEIIKDERFRNSLYPGYGLTPVYAAKCLGKIRNEKAIRPLFEMLSTADSFEEQEAASALKQFEEKSLNFLLAILNAKPLSQDNSRAAFALTHFARYPEVSKAAVKLLCEDEVLAKPSFAQALVLLTENLNDEKMQKQLLCLLEDKKCPQQVKEEISFFAKQWQQ